MKLTMGVAPLTCLFLGGTVIHGFLHIQRSDPTILTRLYSTVGISTTTDVPILIPPFLDDSDDLPYPSLLHSIYVKSVLSDEEAKTALEMARSYAESTGRWTKPDSDRHSTYATVDFPIEDSMELQSYLENEVGLTDKIWQHLHECYGIDHEDMTYLDFFCANYQAKAGGAENSMDRLEAHRDGSLLSFTITLTPPNEFQGGGTFFEALKHSSSEPSSSNHPSVVLPNGVVRPERAGDAVLHSGKILHGADAVTDGSRTVLVGFVDVADWCIRPGVIAEACKEWGRMDVATKRYERQQKMTQGGLTKGWIPNHAKWLPKPNDTHGKSHVASFIRAFPTVRQRAEQEFQTQRRLEVEDTLLRSILLPVEERDTDQSFFNGDITVL